ncbi:Protein of unknown function [Bacillus cytotoxicus]|uniref:Uncharacterized protein n=1 Tax=Bacillus cytotoxicus TaxID=580165 RepID=A0AAX2CKC1_9BACI|nr:Protein of unknown function [Bacillus cytotoxicus]SCN41279.1 Protein of unknown function [Bacillus cytotoxicus]
MIIQKVELYKIFTNN